MDALFWIVIGCVLVEVGTSLWPTNVRRPAPDAHFRSFRLAWTSARAQGVELWLLAALSIILLVVEPRPEFRGAFSWAGALLFSIGLAVRHLDQWQNYLLRNRLERGRFAWVANLPRSRTLIGSRHPDLVGLGIEAAGLLLLVGRWELVPLFSAVLGATMVVRAFSIDASRYPSPGLRARDDELGERISPNLVRCGVIALIAGAAFVMGAIWDREIVLFRGDSAAAATYAATLAQVVGTVGVLAITLGPVLAQLAASEMSVRSSLSLLRHNDFRATVGISLLALGFDFYVLARSGEVGKEAQAWDLADYATVVSAAALLVTAWFASSIPRLMQVRSIVDNELRALDRRWARRVTDDWHDGHPPRYLRPEGDPLESVQRILYSAVQRRDYPTVQTTVELLERQIDIHFGRGPGLEVLHESRIVLKSERGSRNLAAELDAYLTHYLWPVVALAVDLKDNLTLAILTDLWVHVSPADTSVQLRMLKTSYRFIGEPVVVPGESLIRTIITRAAHAGSHHSLVEAVADLLKALPPLIRALPKAEEAEYLRYRWSNRDRGDEDQDTEVPEPVGTTAEARKENDQALERFFDDYIDFLESIGREVLQKGSEETYFHVSYSLIHLSRYFFDERDDRILRSEILNRSMRAIVSLTDYANELHRSGRKDMSSARFPSLTNLYWLIEKLDAASDSDLFKSLAADLTDMIESQWRSRILGYSLVHDVGMTFHYAPLGFVEERSAFIDVLARLVREVASEGWGPDDLRQRMLYRELLESIERQRPTNAGEWSTSPGKEVVQKVRDTIKALRSAGLPMGRSIPTQLSPIPPVPDSGAESSVEMPTADDVGAPRASFKRVLDAIRRPLNRLLDRALSVLVR